MLSMTSLGLERVSRRQIDLESVRYRPIALQFELLVPSFPLEDLKQCHSTALELEIPLEDPYESA